MVVRAIWDSNWACRAGESRPGVFVDSNAEAEVAAQNELIWFWRNFK